MAPVRLIYLICTSVWLWPPLKLAGAETLTAAWRAALISNAQLASARLESDAARFERLGASGAKIPQVWTQAGYQLRSDERSFEIANPLNPSQRFIAPYAQREAAVAAVGVSAPIYTAGRISNSVNSAAARCEAAVHTEAMMRLDLLLDVASAYVDVLRALRDLGVALQSVEALTIHLQNAQSHFDQQRVPRSDLLSAQVALAMGVQERMRRSYELEAARASYNRLLGRPLEADVHLEELSVCPLLGGLNELQAVAVSRRPDVLELCARAAAEQFSAERLRGQNKPQVSLVGRHDFEENRFQTPQGISSAGVVMDWSIYDGGQSRRLAQAQEARAASIGKLADDLRTHVALEVLLEWNSAQEATARGNVAAGALQQADENLRTAMLRYGEGVGTEAEVMDAQSRRAQAARDYFGAGYDATLAQLRLRRAVGILGNGE